jgi:hypothetical protein
VLTSWSRLGPGQSRSRCSWRVAGVKAELDLAGTKTLDGGVSLDLCARRWRGRFGPVKGRPPPSAGAI